MSQVNFSFSKSRTVYLTSFFIPVVILLAVMAGSQVFPLGEKCILRTDMYHQYAPFFSELQGKLKTGGSLKFTWDLGLGVNFMAIIAYYLASPLNLLVGLVSRNYVIEFMTFLILLKTGLCGVSMACYLRYHAPEKGFAAVLVSLCYALSGYVCAYYWNLMWFDAIAAFPIVMMGAEKLMRGESGLLYCISLGFCIFTNYYIAMMICIFLVLYFFAFNILEFPQSFRDFVTKGLRFAFWSLLAAGLAAVMLLPEIAAFKDTASSKNTFPKTAKAYFSVFDMLARHLPMVETEQGLDHWPNIFCGTAAIQLFFLYLTNRKISMKEKAVYLFLCVFLLAGFSVDVLNYLWHGMHYPNSLPARQSFLYIFLVLMMCFRVLENIRFIEKRELGQSLGFAAAFILLAQHTVDDDAFEFWVFWLALLFAVLYGGILYLYRSGYLKRTAAMTLSLFVLAAELSANTAYTSITVTSRTDYTADNQDVKNLIRTAAETENGFFRMERSKRKSKNDGAWLNFPSASMFSSMASSACTSFYKHMGCEASTNAYSITGSTPLVDMLFGIDYELLSNENNEATGLTFMESSGDIYLHKNRYALSPGFMMPEAMAGSWMTDLDDPANVQNSLCDVLKTEQVLIPVPVEADQKSGKFSVTLSEDGLYYAYEDNFKAGDITVKWPDHKKTFNNLDRSYFMELGQCERGTLVSFTAEKEDTDPDISIYRVNETALAQIYEKLSFYEMQITEAGDDYLKGTVVCDPEDLGYSGGNGKMILTTPYDAGWTVLIDGEEAKTFRAFDTFMGVYVPGGLHEIEFSYTPKGLKPGIMISAGSTLIWLALAALWLLKRRDRRAVPEEIPDEAAEMPDDTEEMPEEETKTELESEQ